MSWDSDQKNKIRTLVGLVASLILICVLISIVTSRLVSQKPDWAKHDEDDGHQWLQQELDLTPEETAAVNELEPEYREERATLQKQFEAKIEELRQQIIDSDEFSDEARETIHELHIIHGQLQELSILHYYQMIQVLPPEKKARLRDIAAKALSAPQ